MGHHRAATHTHFLLHCTSGGEEDGRPRLKTQMRPDSRHLGLVWGNACFPLTKPCPLHRQMRDQGLGDNIPRVTLTVRVPLGWRRGWATDMALDAWPMELTVWVSWLWGSGCGWEESIHAADGETETQGSRGSRAGRRPGLACEDFGVGSW